MQRCLWDAGLAGDLAKRAAFRFEQPGVFDLVFGVGDGPSDATAGGFGDGAGVGGAFGGGLEQLDVLLLTVAKPRKVHPDGIHYQSLRYLDPVLADYVGEAVTIRYHPRDLAEIRVFHRDRFLCRAICPELAGRAVGIKDITAARNARRRELTGQLRVRTRVVNQLLAVHQPGYGDLLAGPSAAAAPASPPSPARPALKRYRED